MLVRDVMKGEVLSISPLITLGDACQIFSERNVKYLVVMQGRDIQGILSLIDVENLSVDVRHQIKISDRMMGTTTCIDASSALEEAEVLIRKSGVQALPVCEGETLIGIVTLNDILEFFSRQ